MAGERWLLCQQSWSQLERKSVHCVQPCSQLICFTCEHSDALFAYTWKTPGAGRQLQQVACLMDLRQASLSAGFGLESRRLANGAQPMLSGLQQIDPHLPESLPSIGQRISVQGQFAAKAGLRVRKTMTAHH
jgi:hypothetical protein